MRCASVADAQQKRTKFVPVVSQQIVNALLAVELKMYDSTPFLSSFYYLAHFTVYFASCCSVHTAHVCLQI